MGIMKLTIEDFHCGTGYLFSFFYHKIMLLEKKYEIIRLITLISMFRLKALVSLGRFIKVTGEGVGAVP